MGGETNVSRRSFLKATGGTAAATALTGFTETTTEDTEARAQPQDNTLKLINATMSTLDPIKATDTASGIVIQQMFDALMNYPNGEVQPTKQLATDYQVSDDFTTYTFNLKQGATFHNGTEVTAQDFVYSWERLAASENSRRAYFILDSIGVKHETTDDGSYKPGTLAVRAVDDYTLEMTLSEPFHATLPMLAYTSFAAVPEGIVGDIEGYGGEMSYQEFSTENPIGAGPFKFENWEPSVQSSVTRYDNYHGKVANVDGIHWQIIESDQAQFTYAMNKNADRFGIPTTQYNPDKVSVEKTDDLGREIGTYGPVQNGETLNYLGVATINSFYIGFNTDQVEKPARKAAAYAMNQQSAVQNVFKGRGQGAYHFTPPNIYPNGADAYTKHAKQNYPYGYNQTQLGKARQVMEEAGYGPDNKYKFTITSYQSQTWQSLLQILRDKLASAHINMTIETAPFSTLLQRGRNGDLQAYTLGWIMDWPAPDNFLQLLYPPRTDTSKSAPISYTNWSGTEASKQAREAWQTIQNNRAPTEEAEKARNEAYIKMEEANWEDVVFLNTYHATTERFWYDWLTVPKFGGGGYSRQMLNTASLSERS